jgi:hypothetical protein
LDVRECRKGGKVSGKFHCERIGAYLTWYELHCPD